MRAKPSSQMLAGILDLLLLALIAQEHTYGYRLVRRLQEVGLEEVAEGSVYPALSRLERTGLLLGELLASPAGPARKFYRLTPAGHQALSDRSKTFHRLNRAVGAVLSPLQEETP